MGPVRCPFPPPAQCPRVAAETTLSPAVQATRPQRRHYVHYKGLKQLIKAAPTGTPAETRAGAWALTAPTPLSTPLAAAQL